MIKIKCDDPNRTVQFAMYELERCLRAMCKENLTHQENHLIEIGTYKDFPEKDFQCPNHQFDDEIYIDISHGSGIISGCNPRSVLFSVYRFLRELGCRWPMPGKSGEMIPRDVAVDEYSLKIKERPSYRHRGVCIEGANSNQNILDIIDWMPKLGFNSYFIQFRNGFTFYDHWYSHAENPYLKPETKSVEEIDGYVKQAVEEIKKRGMIYHAVGHGWTCEPFGIKGLGWDPYEGNIDESTKKYFALVNGKRELFDGIALNTNLCYSNPEVRKTIVDSIVEYVENHRQVDVLHFWLADGWNNHCECPECAKMRPSDFYVQILNELDEKLEQRKLNVKIVFLIYVDLLWPPEKMKLKNKDRFILMFAPISRSYSQPFSARGVLPKIPAYERNRLKFPRTAGENISALREWQKQFDGDSFDYDYHLISDHYFDPGYMKCSKILSDDIRELKNIGLNGYISCQVQRNFFPNGLCMHILGRTLWNRETDYSGMVHDYFTDVYGEDGETLMNYMEELSDLFDPSYLRGEKATVNRESQIKLGKIPDAVGKFIPVIEKNMNCGDQCRASCWKILKIHSELILALARSLSEYAKGNNQKADQLISEFYDIVARKEDKLQPVLDGYMYITTMKKRLFKPRF